jgi:CopG family transcriptional regulator, nickel-responsive regulator
MVRHVTLPWYDISYQLSYLACARKASSASLAVVRGSAHIPSTFHGENMQRVTINLDDELAAEIDRLVHARGYQSRSEAIRDLARSGLRQAKEEGNASGDCIAALVYVYEHDSRELPKRLARIFHAHHDLSVSTLHVHLDHDSCMEVTVLRGDAREVRHLGEHVIAERGVHYGRLVMAPADVASELHSHGGPKSHRHLHTHVRKGG